MCKRVTERAPDGAGKVGYPTARLPQSCSYRKPLVAKAEARCSTLLSTDVTLKLLDGSPNAA
jgi:hypothetical protein